jgi:hypothetical protein
MKELCYSTYDGHTRVLTDPDACRPWKSMRRRPWKNTKNHLQAFDV